MSSHDQASLLALRQAATLGERGDLIVVELKAYDSLPDLRKSYSLSRTFWSLRLVGLRRPCEPRGLCVEIYFKLSVFATGKDDDCMISRRKEMEEGFMK